MEGVEGFELVAETLGVGGGGDGFAFGVQVDGEERERLGVFHCADWYCLDCGVSPASLCGWESVR